jgi:hypothetical protein
VYVIFNGEVAEVFTWRIALVPLSNHMVIFAKPVASVEVTFAVKVELIPEALFGVGDTKSNAGAVASIVNILRVVFTFPAESVLVMLT